MLASNRAGPGRASGNARELRDKFADARGRSQGTRRASAIARTL